MSKGKKTQQYLVTIVADQPPGRATLQTTIRLGLADPMMQVLHGGVESVNVEWIPS